jgi:hypothetical protein
VDSPLHPRRHRRRCLTRDRPHRPPWMSIWWHHHRLRPLQRQFLAVLHLHRRPRSSGPSLPVVGSLLALLMPREAASSSPAITQMGWPHLPPPIGGPNGPRSGRHVGCLGGGGGERRGMPQHGRSARVSPGWALGVGPPEGARRDPPGGARRLARPARGAAAPVRGLVAATMTTRGARRLRGAGGPRVETKRAVAGVSGQGAHGPEARRGAWPRRRRPGAPARPHVRRHEPAKAQRRTAPVAALRPAAGGARAGPTRALGAAPMAARRSSRGARRSARATQETLGAGDRLLLLAAAGSPFFLAAARVTAGGYRGG